MSQGVHTGIAKERKERRFEHPMPKYQFEPESREAIGCALEVHRQLGPGFLESVYHNAMTVAFTGKNIPFESERRATVWFQGFEVGHHCFDLVVRESLVVELKAVEELAEIHFAKLRSYLRVSRLSVGLLINFNAPRLIVRRMVNGAIDQPNAIKNQV